MKAGERLPKELAARGIHTMQEASRELVEHYRAAFNEEFAEPGSTFAPFAGPALTDVPCERHKRTVARDDRVSFRGKRLQSPSRSCRRRYIEARLRAHGYPDGRVAVLHGPRRLADGGREPGTTPMTARFHLCFMPLLPHPHGRHAPTGNAPTTRASAGAGPETDRR